MSFKQFATGLTNQATVLPEPGSTHIEFFYGKALWWWAMFCLRLLQGRPFKSQLEAQLPLLRQLVEEAQKTSSSEINVKEIVGTSWVVYCWKSCFFSGVLTAVKLLLVMPGTNATSEQSFSALRRLKTYLRTTMTQQCLNNLMVLHVHKESTDSLDLINIAWEFVAGREGRLRMFGDCRQ